MTLDLLTAGQSAVIRRVGGSGALRRRLMDMGLGRGVTISMIKVAPLGDPVAYNVLGYQLSLRKSEARLIEIEVA
ncbi:MAG: ferrous iron transport protein A [Anaerolineae bacterium]|nr:ferrous iron transport protein A [Anaerolineae bacterium]